MTKLRHIHGPRLIDLEQSLEKVKNSIIVVGVNSVGGNWYIHFLLQDTISDNSRVQQELGIEIAAPTKTTKRKV